MNVEKLSITLPADMAALIRRRVESGSYATNSEVIREALRLWQDRELEREERLKDLREKINQAADNPVRLTEKDIEEHFKALYNQALKEK